MSGTAHSHFGLWGTWRRGPDLVEHVADVVARSIGSEADVKVLYRDDTELTKSGEELATAITGQALGDFRAILIEGEGNGLHVRVAFVRRPTEVLVGLGQPRRARVSAGVVLEVCSTDPTLGGGVAGAKTAITKAIERGRPRGVTRPARHGRAARRDAEHPDGEPGSASRLLERSIGRWPSRLAFPVMFVLLSLAAYVGVIALMTATPIPALYEDQVLDWSKGLVRWLVVGLGAGVAVAAVVAQRWLFPPVEVATLTNVRRGTRALASWATISTVAGALLQIPGFDSLFTEVS